MNLKISDAQGPTDVLSGWQGICRQFGCSEEQLRELYRSDSEPEVISDAEFAVQAYGCSHQPQN